MARTVNVVVPVTIPDHLADEDLDLASLVDQMLDVGYADAVETAEDPELDSTDADIIAELEFGDVYLQPANDLPPTEVSDV